MSRRNKWRRKKMLKHRRDLRNKLIIYKGGGYDGCWWEWNMLMFDEEREFFDIGSSGYAGLPTEFKAREAFHDRKWLEDAEPSRYDLTKEADVVRFTEDTNGSLVKHVFEFLEENEMPYALAFRCATCGCIDHAYVPDTHNMQCSGGLAYSDNDIHCESCHDEHSCDECGDFWEHNEDFVAGYCEFCAKTHCTECYERFDEEELVDNVCSVCRTIEVPDPNQPQLPGVLV